MQLTGSQFTLTSAILGNDIATFPDFPAEIRAPAGTVAGVSGFQVQFSSERIHTPGDRPFVLVAMNPAALKANIGDLEENGIIIINTDSFNASNFKKAGYDGDPLDGDSGQKIRDQFQIIEVAITKMTQEALADVELPPKLIERSKNLFALGLCYWMFSRDPEHTLKWIRKKFVKRPVLVEANEKALMAGYYFGETAEILSDRHYQIKAAQMPPGFYRNITGNSALVLGCLAAVEKSGRDLFLGSYPITPASDILHGLSKYKDHRVRTLQAEDEIAGICSAIGASFAGSLALTTTSGPGLALKQEALGLAIMTELPLVVVNVQRGGPSTGLPTKTEQADLLQTMFGRNGESPCIVLAASSPADCFNMAYEAFRLTTKYITPVILLTDGFIANGSEPWLVPADEKELKDFEVNAYGGPVGGDAGQNGSAPFFPYERNENLARPWVAAGTPGLEHRIGGLESQRQTGNVSYDPDNHFEMILTRQEKVNKARQDIPETTIYGDHNAEICLVGWGSTFGAITAAREKLNSEGVPVAQMHIRYLNPFPADLEEKLSRFKTVIMPEMNLGQLRFLIQGKFGIKITGLPKVTGQPFKINEIVNAVKENM